MPITVNKTVNIWSVIPTVLGALITAFGWGVTYNSMTTADAQAMQQITSINSDIKDIRQTLPQIGQLQFQMTRAVEQIAENKTSNAETNKRIDRVVETFGGKLDTLVESVNKIALRVEGLAAIDKRSQSP